MPVLFLDCHLPHNTPHRPSRYNNEQTTKQTKAINNSYIYIHISCKCDTNRAGHFTLDAYASRPVACILLFYNFGFVLLWNAVLVLFVLLFFDIVNSVIECSLNTGTSSSNFCDLLAPYISNFFWVEIPYLCIWCDVVFIRLMNHNKPNVIYLLCNFVKIVPGEGQN